MAEYIITCKVMVGPFSAPSVSVHLCEMSSRPTSVDESISGLAEI